MWNRIYALFVARNTEFFRDRSALAWSVLLPVLLIFGFAYAFSEDNPEKFKVAMIATAQSGSATDAFKMTRFIRFIEVDDIESSLRKIERHQIDLLFDANTRKYWVNQTTSSLEIRAATTRPQQIRQIQPSVNTNSRSK